MEIYNGTYCVYVHTNKINGKMYVGQTVYGDDPNRRWQNGKRYEGCRHFFIAIEKYGWDNFQHDVVASHLTLEEANNFEELLILKLDTRNPLRGYNIAFGGSNKQMSEETKKMMSEIRLGIHFSDEHRQRISEANKGKYVGEKHHLYGTHRSEQTKQKISEANKGRCRTEETKKKISQSSKGKILSDETKRKIAKKSREAMLGRSGKDSNKSIPVYSPELNMRFDSMQQAAEFVNTTRSSIARCCNGGRKHAGKHPVTQELLSWIKLRKDGDCR